MNSVNFVRELVPPYPLRTNARAGRALRQLSLVGTDAEPTQPTQAGDVMANLNESASEAPEGRQSHPRGSRAVSQPNTAPKPPTADAAKPAQINTLEARDHG